MEQPAGVRTLYLFIFGKFEHILSPLLEASRDPQAQTHTHTRTYNIHAAIGTQVTRICGQGRGRFVLFCMATLFYVNVVIAQQLRKEAGGGYCRRSRRRRWRRSWNWSCSWRRSQRRCLRAGTRILSSASERATSNQATNFQFAPSSASPLSPHHTLFCPAPLSHRSVECAT